MRFEIVSWNRKALEREAAPLCRKLGYRIDWRRPEFVICVGGDGTFLYGERLYPGVPKVLVKHKCTKKCRGHGLERILRALEDRKYRIVEKMKVQGSVNGDRRRMLVGLNEINIHYRLPCAIGLDLWINGKRKLENVLGDGLIAATPYGSTGYFRSVAKKTFSRGIGLAFNNPVKRVPARIVSDKSDIRVRVVKHSGWMASDCSKRAFPLEAGDFVEILKHPEPARIVRLKGMPEKLKL